MGIRGLCTCSRILGVETRAAARKRAPSPRGRNNIRIITARNFRYLWQDEGIERDSEKGRRKAARRSVARAKGSIHLAAG